MVFREEPRESLQTFHRTCRKWRSAALWMWGLPPAPCVPTLLCPRPPAPTCAFAGAQPRSGRLLEKGARSAGATQIPAP